MNLMRHVVVFDAADLAAESSFWAGMPPRQPAERPWGRDYKSASVVSDDFGERRPSDR
jgi:hypothetical protein